VTIAVVQRTYVSGALSGSYPSNITATNSVFVAVISFNSSNVTIATSAVTVAGQSLTKLVEAQSAYLNSQTNYVSIWGAANSPGGSKTVSATSPNSSLNPADGLVIWEASGLGTSWAVDKSNSGSGSGTAVSSGATGALSNAGQLVLGAMLAGQQTTGTPTGLTNTQAIDAGAFQYSWGGDSIDSTAASYTFAATATSGTNVAAIVTVNPASAPVKGGKQRIINRQAIVRASIW